MATDALVADTMPARPEPKSTPLVRLATPAETAAINRDGRWQQLEAVFRGIHHDPDLMAIRALYATVAAHYLSGPTVWMFAVAPPSSGKTEALMPLQAMGATIISAVTPQTFISGWTRRKKGQSFDEGSDASLLNRIKNGIIVCKDFSQVLSMPKKTKGPILADLRDIYDGYISKEFGTGERKEWKGRITLIAGVTQDIDSHYSVFQTLGERFVQIRWKRPGGVKAALMAMRTNLEQSHRLLEEAVRNLLGPIRSSKTTNPCIPEPQQVRIANLAEFTVRARTHVPRDGYTREIVYMPEPEASPRLAQQLEQLARGSALLDGRPEVDGNNVALAERVALDSIRADRRAILDRIRAGEMTVGELAKAIRLSQPSVSRRVEELRGLGLVEWDDSPTALIRLADHARQLLAGEADD